MRPLHRAPRWSVIVTGIVQCLAILVSDAVAQAPIWVKLPPPASVGLHVRDSRRDRELFFDEAGLLAVPATPANEWQRIWTGTNPASSGRDFAFYDPARDRIWTMTNSLSDTLKLWFMDLSGNPLVWTSQSYLAGPIPQGTDVRYLAFAFDPIRDRVVTFGGYSNSATNDVYTLTLSGIPQWTQETVGGPGPGPRFNSTMVYDPWRDRMLVFGGGAFGPVYYDETWALSLGAPMSWSFLTPTQVPPSGRYPAASALDTQGQRWFIMGNTAVGGNFGGDAWALDLSPSTPATAAAWTEIAPGANDPQPLGSGALFEQPAVSRLLSYDGADLWALSLGSVPTWDLIGDGSLGLVRRTGLVTFVDAERQRVYAGLGPDAFFQYRPLDQDVPWVTLPTQGPRARYGAIAVTDDVARRALVFGGAASYYPDVPDDEFADLWSFDLDDEEWTLVDAVNPPLIRTEALGVFDTARRRLIVHGGRYTNPGPIPLGDTWVFDAVDGTWSSPAAGSYGDLWGEVGIYDPVRDRVIAFGGTNSTGILMREVHVLPLGPSIGTWSTLPTLGPSPYWLGQLVTNSVDLLAASYDPAGDRMIVVAGEGPATSTWALNLEGTPTWTLLSPIGALPAQRFGTALVGDPGRRRLLMVGGHSWHQGVARSGDTWALYFDSATPAQVTLLGTEVAPDQVTLRWYASEDVSASVYRRTPGEDWIMLGVQIPDGSRVIRWIDRDVIGGASYDYRLGIRGPDGEHFFGEIHVEVSLGSVLALASVHPNPTQGKFLVNFSLANRSPASLELLDVAGRRLIRREVGTLGPGGHAVPLDVDRPPAGLYFVRLIQDGRARSVKVALVR